MPSYTKEEAEKRGKELCKLMGANWKPKIWENLGWHFTAKLEMDNGYIEIYTRRKCSKKYWVDSRMPGQSYLSVDDPKEGVKELLRRAEADIAEYTRIVDVLKKMNNTED